MLYDGADEELRPQSFDIRDFALAGVLAAVGAAAGATTYSRGQLERLQQEVHARKRETDRVEAEAAQRDQRELDGIRAQMRTWHTSFVQAEAARRTIAAEAAHPDRELEQAFSDDALRHPDHPPPDAAAPEAALRTADQGLAALQQQGRHLKARYDVLVARRTQDPK